MLMVLNVAVGSHISYRNCSLSTSRMASDTLKRLTSALNKLELEITPRKERLEASLLAGEQISDEDSEWLDHMANLVDEHCALDILSGAADYAAGLEKLTPPQRAAIERLHHISDSGQSGTPDDRGGKRKRTSQLSTMSSTPN